MIRPENGISPRPRDGDPHPPPLRHSQGGYHLGLQRGPVPPALGREERNPASVEYPRQLAEGRAPHEQAVGVDHARQRLGGVPSEVKEDGLALHAERASWRRRAAGVGGAGQGCFRAAVLFGRAPQAGGNLFVRHRLRTVERHVETDKMRQKSNNRPHARFARRRWDARVCVMGRREQAFASSE